MQAAAAHAGAWMEFEDFDYYLDPYTTLIVHGAYGFVTGSYSQGNAGFHCVMRRMNSRYHAVALQIRSFRKLPVLHA